MRDRRLPQLLAVLVSLLLVQAPLSAQEPEITPGVLGGSGYEQLDFDGAPDEDGLIWMLQEPKRNGDYWGLAAWNTSDEPVIQPCRTIEFKVDGTWYLSGLDNDTLYLKPYTLPPGGIGIAVGETLSPADSNWTDVRLVPCDDGGLDDPVVDLTVERLKVTRDGEVSGYIYNQSDGDAVDMLLYVFCVSSSGVLTHEFVYPVDLRVLEPDDQERFEHELDPACNRVEKLIAYAVGSPSD